MSVEKEYSLVFVFENNSKQVLLGMKKRGFGEGKWNGFGGKIELGETIEEGAIRELQEESGITAHNLLRRGYLEFHMLESRKVMKVYVFSTSEYTGDPVETEEMKPQWFSASLSKETEAATSSNLPLIPLDRMWKDDAYWLPMLLGGKNFTGRFDYSDEDTILDYSLTVDDNLK